MINTVKEKMSLGDGRAKGPRVTSWRWYLSRNLKAGVGVEELQDSMAEVERAWGGVFLRGWGARPLSSLSGCSACEPTDLSD